MTRTRSGARPQSAQIGVRAIVGVLVTLLALFLWCGDSRAARIGKSDTQKALDQLYESALEGTDRAAAIAEIFEYVKQGSIGFDNQQYAILRLTELRAPEAEEFLLDVIEGDVEFANSDRLFDDAWIAYIATRSANSESDETSVEILFTALDDALTRKRSLFVASWIIGELCKLGDREHFERIKAAISTAHVGRNVDERLGICEWQIHILAYTDDRFESLTHALFHEDPIEMGEKVLDWIFGEIVALDRKAAEEAIADYILRLQDDMALQRGDEAYYIPFWWLRSFGWNDEDFKDRGITPQWWLDG